MRKNSLEKERLLGKFTAEPKPPSNAVADAPPRAALPKVAVRWSGNHPDPRTPSFGRCPVICYGMREFATMRPRSSIVKCAPNSVPLSTLVPSIANSNINVGGNYLPIDNQVFDVRGLGFIESLNDIKGIVLSSSRSIPIRVNKVAEVMLVTRFRP
jgi:hypothetical protein